MAQELSFEDALKGAATPTATPTGELSFEDALKGGQSPSASATPSVTPYTDQAMAGSQKWYNWDPPWLRRVEDPARAALAKPALPAAQDVANFARYMATGGASAGLPPAQIPEWLRPAAGMYEETRQMVTPANALITAGLALQPELIPWVAPMLAAPMVGRLPGQAYRVATGQATPEESGALAADIAMLGAPAVAHWAVPPPEYPVLPQNRAAAVGPVNWRKRYGIPGPPIPWAGAEITKPPGEAVGEPIYQPTGELAAKGAPDAIKPSDAQVETGETALGVETRPTGEVPKPGDSDYVERKTEGTEAGGAIPPTKVEHAPGTILTHGHDRFRVLDLKDDQGRQFIEPIDQDGNALGPPVSDFIGELKPLPKVGPSALAGGVTRREEDEPAPTDPMKMTAAQLSDYLNREYYSKGALAPTKGGVNLAKLLQDKKAAEAKAGAAQPAQPAAQPAVAPSRQPIRELLSQQELSEYDGLIDKWASLNREGNELLRDPSNPRVQQITNEQIQIRNRMRQIESKLPDSDIYDIVSLGTGATGNAIAVHGAAENRKTLVLEHTGGRGTASGKTGRYSNVMGPPSPLGQAGATRELMDKLQAQRMGTEFRTVDDIESYSYDPQTKLWTIKTKGGGEGGAGGNVIRTRILDIATGTRPRNAPFQLIGADGKPIVNTGLRIPGQMVHIDDAAGMRAEAGPGGAMAAVGAANSSAQGAVIEAARGTSGPFHVIARGPSLASVSDYLLPEMRLLKKEGRLHVHSNSTVDHVEAPSEANGFNYVVVTKETPKGRLTPEEMAALPVKERIPVKSVGSFIGSVPNTSMLPKDWLLQPIQHGDPLSGLVRTTEDLRPLRLNAQGQEEPVPGAFVGGSVRAAPGVNRMATSEGEGARAVALALGDLKQMKDQGLTPQWKNDIEETLQNLGYLSDQPADVKVTPKAREIGPRKVLPVPGGPFKLPKQQPPKPLRVEPQDTSDLIRATGGVQQPQQDQGDQRQGRFPGVVPFREPPQTRPTEVTTSALIEQQKTNPRPLTDQDRAKLNAHEEGLRQQYTAIADDQLRAYATGDEERIAENDQKLSETLDKFYDLNNARKKAGEPEIPHPPEQFSLEEMLKAKRAVNKGRDLTPFEAADVLKWQELIKEKKDALEAYRAGPESKGYWEELKKRAEAYRTGVGPKKSLLPDPVNLQKQAELIKAQKDWEASLERDRTDQLDWWRKTPDWFLKWRRAGVISGVSSVAKLMGATFYGTLLLPARELVGTGLRHLPLISEVASKAPREGQGFNIRAEAEAQAEMWKNLISDFGKNIRGQKPDFESVFGKVDQLPPELQNYVGFLHGALKSPLARNEFTRSFQTIAEFEAKHGADLTDPLVQMQIGQKSVENAAFWRFQNRNQATKVYRMVTSALDRSGGFGKAVSFAAKTELPIVTVPSNFLARTFEGVFGTIPGLTRLGIAYGKGIETLKPEQADLIMRNLKTGGLGAALTMIGALNPDYFGGFYRAGGKKDPTKPGFGVTRIGDYDIPPYLQDNPFVILPQFGATVTQVASSYLHKRDSETAGLMAGIYAGIYGAASNDSFIRESIDIGKTGDPRVAADVLGEHARSIIIPRLLQQVASGLDPAENRYPRGMAQQLMVGIPGLRESVPDILPSQQKLGTKRRGYLPRRAPVRVKM